MTFNLQVEVTGISVAKPQIAAKDKIGFLSSIKPDPILRTAFLVGTGLPSKDVIFNHGDDKDYKPAKIKGERDKQKADCAVIATVGGVVTGSAVGGDTGQRYVSLVGSSGPIISDTNIKGGVSLESYKLNSSRKDYLKSLSGGGVYTDANIFLYANQNSTMHADETTAWASAGTVIQSSVAQALGVNSVAGFASDFASGGLVDTAGPLALIISDDPFFRANRGELIQGVNSWLGRGAAAANKRVVYPSQIYGSPVLIVSGTAQPPTAQKSILYGPDLIAAYHLLGILARCSYEDATASPGFISALPFIVTVR